MTINIILYNTNPGFIHHVLHDKMSVQSQNITIVLNSYDEFEQMDFDI